MSRIRTLKPDMAESEVLAGIPREALFTWVMLWPHCDDFGHHRADPRLVLAAIYPLRDDVDARTVEADLDRLEEAGRICRYVGCDGKAYLHITGWDEHQRVDNASKVWLPLCSKHEADRECRQHGAACGGSTEFAATRRDSPRLAARASDLDGPRKTDLGRRKTILAAPDGAALPVSTSTEVTVQAVVDAKPRPVRGEIVAISGVPQLVGEFVDRCSELGIEPIPRDKARVGKDCKELLAAGKAPDLISEAIGRMVQRGRPVSALVPLVAEVERERAGHGGQPKRLGYVERDFIGKPMDPAVAAVAFGRAGT